ncbi:hypothetical protein POM88_020029 [Heracleum sosnowskyi]|uniref:Uncharacterized protein n=1 Tax=Heracleum sosnowskyi TaxID=360622 RepID=A0AAD8MRL4_9APIA|nr:hypothetical protein POM88_020029 [Heracleum sosnowskyi]
MNWEMADPEDDLLNRYKLIAVCLSPAEIGNMKKTFASVRKLLEGAILEKWRKEASSSDTMSKLCGTCYPKDYTSMSFGYSVANTTSGFIWSALMFLANIYDVSKKQKGTRAVKGITPRKLDYQDACT